MAEADLFQAKHQLQYLLAHSVHLQIVPKAETTCCEFA